MLLKKSLLKINTLVIAGMLMFNAQAGIVSSTLDQTTTHPDISAGEITTSYTGDMNLGSFSANGDAVELTDVMGVSHAFDLGGVFTLNATSIQANLGLAEGTLMISGAIPSLGYSGTILTATLAQIGGPSLALNFIFNVTGGFAAGMFGDTVGVIMNNSGYDGIASFASPFGNAGGTASADTFVAVPTPSTLALLLIGFVALGFRKKLHG